MSRKTPDGKWTRRATNTNSRGNSRDRRRRREYLINTFGDGVTCVCSHCPTVLTIETVNVDRVTPGWKGGRYTRDNIRPSCAPCGSEQGGRMGSEAKAAKRAAFELTTGE
jgi:hypothetical protein